MGASGCRQALRSRTRAAGALRRRRGHGARARPGHHGAVDRGPGGGARAVEEAGQQRRGLRHRGPAEDLLLLPHHQDLLPPLRPEPRLRPGPGPRQEGGRSPDPRRRPPGRPARRPVRPERPARAQAAGGPGQLQAPGRCLLVTFARHYPGDFGPALHAAPDRSLSHVTSALASKYR